MGSWYHFKIFRCITFSHRKNIRLMQSFYLRWCYFSNGSVQRCSLQIAVLIAQASDIRFTLLLRLVVLFATDITVNCWFNGLRDTASKLISQLVYNNTKYHVGPGNNASCWNRFRIGLFVGGLHSFVFTNSSTMGNKNAPFTNTHIFHETICDKQRFFPPLTFAAPWAAEKTGASWLKHQLNTPLFSSYLKKAIFSFQRLSHYRYYSELSLHSIFRLQRRHCRIFVLCIKGEKSPDVTDTIKLNICIWKGL